MRIQSAGASPATPATSWIRVIGVAGDVRDQALDKAPIDAFYVPFGQYPSGGNLLIRSTRGPGALART